ncbi:maleate cis-trans isomerase family protein [Microlunatus soli]|uniref:Maleate cis-trans isomerase n=1 Tax=Microlunatus soli TaxID=630515 RepID=A0A1H1ZL36_9ACTN|nr:maleate cis-trans isomerase [Microlunatus soli]SDT33936.1 Maleate cis-trans isomerase [Microlunatus soli]
MTTIGLLYPGHSAEDDFAHAEERLDGVRLPLVHTAMASDAHRPDELRAWGSAQALADGATELKGEQPEAIIWACTSGSFVFGWEGAQAQADELSAVCGLPASSTSLAFAGAARQLGVDSVAVAASYPDDVARLFVDFLSGAGITVAGFGASDILYASDVGKLGRDEVITMIKAADTPQAGAILVPDTAMHTLGILDDLEAAVGKPVLTANQVSVWEGLRVSGQQQAALSLGALFADRAAVSRYAERP